MGEGKKTTMRCRLVLREKTPKVRGEGGKKGHSPGKKLQTGGKECIEHKTTLMGGHQRWE